MAALTVTLIFKGGGLLYQRVALQPLPMTYQERIQSPVQRATWSRQAWRENVWSAWSS